MTFAEALEDLEKSIKNYYSAIKSNKSRQKKNVKELQLLAKIMPTLKIAIHKAKKGGRILNSLETVDGLITKGVNTSNAIEDIIYGNKVENGVDVGLSQDSKGEAALSIGRKNDKDVESSLTISRNELKAELKKEWELFKCSTRSIPVVGPLCGKFGVALVTELAGSGTFNYDEGYVETAVNGSFTGTGNADLYLNVVELLHAGVTAELEAITTYGGAVRKKIGGDTSLKIDALTGELKFNMDVFVRGGDAVMAVYELLGGDEETLTWKYEFLSCSLFKFEVPGYENGEFTGEINLEVGDDANAVQEKLEEGNSFIEGLVDVVMWGQEVYAEFPQFLKDLNAVMWDIATMDVRGFVEGTYDMINQTAAKDEYYNKVCDAALKAAFASKEVMLKLRHMDSDARYTFMKNNVSLVPLVQKAYKQLYEEGDFDLAQDTLDQIAAVITKFEIYPEDNEFDLGDEADLKVVIVSDRQFPIGHFRIGVRCNGKEIKSTTQIYTGSIESQSCIKDFSIDLPKEGKTTKEGAKWEFFVSLDLEGILKDKYVTKKFEMHKKVNKGGGNKALEEKAASGNGGGSMVLDDNAYNVGHPKPDTMDVKLQLWNAHKLINRDKAMNVTCDVWVAVMYNGKRVARQIKKSVTFNTRKAEVNLYDVNMPGYDETVKKNYLPSSKGAKWTVTAGIVVEGYSVTLATRSIKVYRPYDK